MGSRDDVPGAAGTVPGAELATRSELPGERRIGECAVVVFGDQSGAKPAELPRDDSGAPRDAASAGEPRAGEERVEYVPVDLKPIMEAIGDGPIGVPWDGENNRPIDYKLREPPLYRHTLSVPHDGRIEPHAVGHYVGVDHASPGDKTSFTITRHPESASQPSPAPNKAGAGFHTVLDVQIAERPIRLFVNGQERDGEGRPVQARDDSPPLTEEQKVAREQRFTGQMWGAMRNWVEDHLPVGEVGMAENMLMACNVKMFMERYERLKTELEFANNRVAELEQRLGFR